MARGFNLTAEINLRGPANIRQVVSNIRRQLGTINANVNVNIDPRVSRNVGNLNTRLNALSATLNQTAASATNATTAFNNLATAMASVGNIRLPNNIPAQINVTANAATNAARAVAQTRTEFEDFGRQAGLAVRRFAAFSSVTSVIYGFTNALSAGIKQYIEFDRQIVRLTQVTNETKAGLGSLVSEITRLSTGFGVASADIANVAVTLAQAGLNANDTRKALEALAKSALAPSFDSLNETVEGSIALMRQFGISAGQLEGALGSINAVAAAFAVEASDLITAIQRTGGVFAAASNGVSQGTDALNEFIAVFTSVRATTRESAETIATGLRTIFTRIQRADTIEALKEYGVVLTDLEGKFVGPYEATRRLAEGLGRLDPRDLKFSQIVEELGGFRQIGKVLPLIQQFSTAQEALKVAQAGQGSLAAEAAKGQLALAVQFQKVREEFSALMRSFGESQSFQALVKIGLSLASALIKVADATKGLLPLIGVMAAFRGVSALTQFAGGFGGGFRGGRQRANSGGVIGFAKGGSVPGVGNSDSVPAMLTPGEFVMNKGGVARIGKKNLEAMNRGGIVKFGKGTGSKGVEENQTLVQLPLSDKTYKGTAFTHIVAPITEENFSPALKKYLKAHKNEFSISALYSNMGLDLPKLWNANWDQQKDYKGAFSKNLSNYIANNDVFKTLKSGGGKSGKFRFTGRSESPAQKLLNLNYDKLQKKLASKVMSTNKFYDTDKDDVYTTLPKLLKESVVEVLDQESAAKLQAGFEEISVVKKQRVGKKASREKAGKIIPSKQNKFFGGFIQKFANAGEVKEDIDLTPYGEIGKIALRNRKQDQSLQQAITDALVKTLADLGNEAGIRDRGVAIPFNLQRKVRKDGITSGRLDSLVVAGILNEAMAVDKTEKDRLRGVRKVAIAGLQPIDYSDDKEWTLDLGEDHPLNGQSYIAMIRGFNKAYLKDIERLRERQRQASLDFAKDTTATEALGPLGQTDTKIYGPLRPLAIDFDETLAFNTKMLDEEGKEDLTLYAMRDKVEAQLAKARPTRLAERLVEVEKKNPGIVRKLTRVLTARPQSTADLVAATLSRFGLPYQVTDITGVSKGLGTDVAAEKAANLAQIERFIDDNEENIKAAEKKGIQSYRYQEPESFDDQKMYTKTGEGNIEGALLEQALAQKLGYQINVDALEATRAIDFPVGLGNAASLFNLPSNIETEVKRTLNGSAFDKARSEFERYFKENPDRFNLGGLVQGFQEGSPGGIKDRSTKNIRRGSRGPKGFVPLKPKQYAQFAEQAYAQAGEYGGPGWGDHLGVPLPKPLAEYAQKIQQWVFESGGAGMSLGKKLVKIPDDIEPDAFEALKPDLIKQYDGWYAEIEEILPFGRATPAKTPAVSAREARANAALAAEAGNMAYTQAEEAIGSFKKTGQLSFDPAIDSHIQKSFPGYIAQLQKDLASETDPDEKASIQRKLSKAQKALPDYQALLQGVSVPNQGRITGLSETLYSLLDQYGSNEVSETEIDNIIKSLGKKIPEKNLGGIIQKFATGGSVDLYHGSNTGTNDSVLNSFKTQGARSDIASGYGQGSGFFVYTEKNRAISQAKMRVGGGGNFVLAQGDKAGKPMVLTFNETLDPATYDLDYELQKGLVVDWLYKNFNILKEKIAPKLTAKERYPGVIGVVDKNREQGIMSSGINVQDDIGGRQTIYSGSDANIKEGELIGKIMNRLQANDPDIVNAFESELFKAPLGLVLKYVGANPLKPTNIETFASGGNVLGFADGGYVPALLTPGEAVIGPKMAKRIGYAKLNKMNHADKYASGGEVGIVPGSGNSDTFGPVPLAVGSFVIRKKATEALGFNSGGRVQKFFFGGRGRRAPAARPDTVSVETIGASTQATTALTQLAETLQALGVNGSRSAALLNRSYQATAAEAQRAAAADLAAARAAGAGADVIFDLERAIQESARATQSEIALRGQLGDISGEAIQDALSLVQQEIDRTRATAEANLRAIPSPTTGAARTEEEVQADLRAGEADRRRQAYETVAFSGGVTGASLDLTALNASGDDLARLFQILSRDATTLDQMNQRLTQTTRQRIEADLAAGRISEDEAQTRREALEAEINARRRAVEGTAAAEGATSPGAMDGAERQANTMRNMAIMTVGTLVADVLDAKSSATEAGIGGAIAGASQTYGASNQLIQEANNMATSLRETNPRMASLAGNVARVASRLQLFAVVAQAARQAYNAVRNFAIELEKRKVEMALEGLTEGFDKLSKDINQVDLRNQLQSKVIEAAQAAEQQRQKSQETASAGLVNGLDVLTSNIQSYFSGNSYASRQSAVRGQVLETEGIIPYLETLIAGQQGIENVRGQSSRITGRETAAIFKPVAENVNQVITSRIKAGESVEQILGGPQAEDFKRTLVLADASLAAHIRSIELDTSMSEKSRQERIQEVIAIAGAAKTREVAEIALREKTQKNFGNMISVYTRSLQRMFNNMDQAIGATVFSLEKMKSSVDLSASSFQGQAQAGEVRLSASNIIQNPTAYSTQEVQKAAAIGGSMYGPRSAEMTQLATLGDTITSSVMSTINNTLRDQGPGVTNEALTRIIDRNLKDTLRNLGLPPELSDKLAKEVGDSIVDIRKEGEDNVDYTKLSEKIAGLGSVTEVAKNAQQNVIKALEHYQSVLNQYTANLNRITELEASARDRSRKSIQLVTDASLNLAKALGRTVRAADAFAKRDADVARQTGGLTDPSDIFNRFLDLESVRQRQQSTVSQAAEQGLSGATDFVKFNNELKTTNIALRENRAALEDMANNTEKASAAMDAIQQAQQKASGRVNFLEKMVTATPDELESMNGALMRLQKNINGQVNTIQNSVGAQKAYMDALKNGANAAQAMREAQAAFANERKETLGALQDLLPFLGDNQQGNEIRANVLETMLQESGMGMSPIMQQVLNGLRNPEQDPSTAAAIQYYNQAINEQANATRLLGKLDADLADKIARSNSQLIVEGLTKAVLTFTNSELKDIAGNVNSIVSIMKNPGAAGAVAAAPGIATGGLIYASAGQMVNFQPRGTDTVPAMLTPGEFVVNRKATQANLPLLKSINNGYANGGRVSYYAAGGFVTNWGDPTKLTESNQTLSKPILDPTPENNGKEWELAKARLFAIPNAYTVNYDPFPQPIPSKANFDLDSPSLTANAVVPGYTPDIVKRGKYYDYSENAATRAAAETLRPAKDVNQLYFRNPFDEGNLIKDLPKNKEQETKDAIKTKFSGIEGIDPVPKTPDPASFGSAPNVADVFNQSPGKIQTSSIGSSQGLFYNFGTNAPSINPKSITDSTGSPALGIYELNTYADVIPEFVGGGRPNAVSLVDAIGKKNLSFGVYSPYASTWYSGKDWQIKAPKSIIKYPIDFNTALNTIPGDQVARKNAENLRSVEWIKNTQDFLNDRIPYNEIDNILQNQLSNLFSGTKGSEIIVRPNTQLFDKLGSPDSIIVAQNTMRDKFIVALESAIGSRETSKRKNIKFGIPGAGFPIDADFTLDDGFRITDTRGGGRTVNLPFMINGKLEDLGLDFQKQAGEEAFKETMAKGGISTQVLDAPIKLNLPAAMLPPGITNGIDIPINYTQYTGRLYDDGKKDFIGDPFTYLLPNPTEQTLFKEIQTDKRRLFTNKKYSDLDILAASNLTDPNIGILVADVLKSQLNKDANLADKIQQLKKSVKLTFDGGLVGLIKSTASIGEAGVAGKDIFSAFSNIPFEVPIGEFFVDKLQSLQTKLGEGANKADTEFVKMGVSFDDNEARQATINLIRGSMQLFNRIAGLPSGWIAANGGSQALRIAALGDYQEAASIVGGILNGGGNIVSQLMAKAQNQQAVNVLSNAHLLLSGGANVLGDISQGETSLLKQFLDAGVAPKDIFRSYGARAKFGKVSAMRLSGDWKNLLTNQLNGTKIRTVGRNGTITESSLATALPENSNVSDLVKIIFNPYNEFQQTDTRRDLIQKFGNDLSNLRAPNSTIVTAGNALTQFTAKYFDPMTLSWIREGLTRLSNWYGGVGDWLGQDYFFDKNAQPDNAARIAEFVDSFNRSGMDIYQKAQEAQVLFGLANQFGPLPSLPWFTARAAAAAGVQKPDDPMALATGGVVYASTGKLINYQPRGTDTVPAMLTPGEFVVNRSATQKHLPLLQAINSGATNPSPYSRGGVVYLQNGSNKPISLNSINEAVSVKMSQPQPEGVTEENLKQTLINSLIEDLSKEGSESMEKIQTMEGIRIQKDLMPGSKTEKNKIPRVQKFIRDIGVLLYEKRRNQTDAVNQLIAGLNVSGGKNSPIDAVDLTNILSKDLQTLSIINPYLDDSWWVGENIKGLFSWAGTTNDREQFQTDASNQVRSLGPKLDIWHDILSKRTDLSGIDQKIKDLRKEYNDLPRWTPLKKLKPITNELSYLLDNRPKWKAKQSEYQERKVLLEDLISLRSISGTGSASALEGLIDMGLGVQSQSATELSQLSQLGMLPEDVRDEGLKKGAQVGLRNLLLSAAVVAAAPIALPATAVGATVAALGTAGLTIAGSIGGIMALSAADELVKTEKEKLLEQQAGYQSSAGTAELLFDIADVAFGGAALVAGPLRKLISKTRIGQLLKDKAGKVITKKGATKPAAQVSKAADDAKLTKATKEAAEDTKTGKPTVTKLTPAQRRKDLIQRSKDRILEIRETYKKIQKKGSLYKDAGTAASVDGLVAEQRMWEELIIKQTKEVSDDEALRVIEKGLPTSRTIAERAKKVRQQRIRTTSVDDLEGFDLPFELENLINAQPLGPALSTRLDNVASKMQTSGFSGQPAYTRYHQQILTIKNNEDYFKRIRTMPENLLVDQIKLLKDPNVRMAYQIPLEDVTARLDAFRSRARVKTQAVQPQAQAAAPVQPQGAGTRAVQKAPDVDDVKPKPKTDDAKPKTKTENAKPKDPNELKGLTAAKKAEAIRNIAKNAREIVEAKIASIKDKWTKLFLEEPNPGYAMQQEGRTLVDGIFRDADYIKAYQAAKNSGATDRLAYIKGIDAYDKAGKLNPLQQQLKDLGYTIDSRTGAVSFTDDYFDRFVTSNTAYRTASETEIDKAINDAIKSSTDTYNSGRRFGKIDPKDAKIRAEFDAPGSVKARTWSDFLKEQKVRVKNGIFNKYTRLGLLGSAMAAWYYSQQNRDKGVDKPIEGKPLPGGAGGGAGGGAAAGGAAAGGGAAVAGGAAVGAGRPPDFDPAAGAQAQPAAGAQAQINAKSIPVPDYYDELTYKQYASKIIARGQFPKEPDRSRFTTAAFYSIDQGGNKFRTTAYEQRGGNRLGYSARAGFVPGRGPMDARQADQDQVEAALDAGRGRKPKEFGGRGEQAADQNLQAGFTPVGRFSDQANPVGVRNFVELPSHMRMGQGRQKETAKERDDRITRQYAVRAQAERGGKKIEYSKGPDKQYRDSLAWYINRRGEYGYYSTKNQKTKENWMKKFAWADAMSSGGIVYASNGTLVPYQPKGTDTVPAMLTPGEFVVNRAATQKNLPLLKSINSGAMSKGGVVYLAKGGEGGVAYSDQPSSNILPSLKFEQQSRIFNETLKNIPVAVNDHSAKTAETYDQKAQTRSSLINNKSQKILDNTLKTIKGISDLQKTIDDAQLDKIYPSILESYSELRTIQAQLRPLATKQDLDDAEQDIQNNDNQNTNNIQLNINNSTLGIRQDIQDRYNDLGKLIIDQHIITRKVILSALDFLDADDPTKGGRLAQLKDINPLLFDIDPDKPLQNPNDPNQQRREIADFLSSGGMVYASNGMLVNYQPRGTDTVPAMLTPGEFVVNRAATQANLPLLQAINNGVSGYAQGGVVYAAGGGGPYDMKMIPSPILPVPFGGNGVPQPGFKVPLDKQKAIEAYNLDLLEKQILQNLQNGFGLDIDAVHELGKLKDTFNYSPSEKNIYELHELIQKLIGGNDAPPIGGLFNPGPIQFGNPPRLDNSTIAGMLQTLYDFNSPELFDKTKGMFGFFNYKEQYRTHFAPNAPMPPAPLFKNPDALNFKSSGGVVYAQDGKQIPKNNSNQGSPTSAGTVDITNANPALEAMFNSLKSYASDSSKNGALAQAFDNLKAVNLVVSDQATRDMIGGKNAVAAYQYMSDAESGTAYFSSNKPKTDSFMHEMAHALAKMAGRFATDYTGFPSVARFIEQMKSIPSLMNDPMVYKPEFLLSNPKELFPTLVQLTGSFPNLVREPLNAVMQAMGFDSGGVVYANNGMLVNYQPRGTDTVPAMLTPGEFVVNRAATQRNLPLLQSINSGHMSNGGIVYFEDGGLGHKKFVGDADRTSDTAFDRQNDLRMRALALEALALEAEERRLRQFKPVSTIGGWTDEMRARLSMHREQNMRDLFDPYSDFSENIATLLGVTDSIVPTITSGIGGALGLAGGTVAAPFAASTLVGAPVAPALPLVGAVGGGYLGDKTGDLINSYIGGPIERAIFGDYLEQIRQAHQETYDASSLISKVSGSIVTGGMKAPKTLVNALGSVKIPQATTSALKLDEFFKTGAYSPASRQFSGTIEQAIAAGMLNRGSVGVSSASLLRTMQGPDLYGQAIIPAFMSRAARPLQTGASELLEEKSGDILSRSNGGLIYAARGTLVNYQSKGTDTVPAMLTPGEFVVNAKATSKNLSLLQAINSGGMSNGGIVYLRRGGSSDPNVIQNKGSYALVPPQPAIQNVIDPQLFTNINRQLTIFASSLGIAGRGLSQFSGTTTTSQFSGGIDLQSILGNFTSNLQNIATNLGQLVSTIQGVNNTNGGEANNQTPSGPDLTGLASFTQKFDSLIQQLQNIIIPPEVNINLVQNKAWDVNVNGAEALKALLQTGLGQMIQEGIDNALNIEKDKKEPQQ